MRTDQRMPTLFIFADIDSMLQTHTYKRLKVCIYIFAQSSIAAKCYNRGRVKAQLQNFCMHILYVYICAYVAKEEGVG